MHNWLRILGGGEEKIMNDDGLVGLVGAVGVVGAVRIVF
jgi:hypothetical protein